MQVILSLEWKAFIYIQYYVSCQWPLPKNVAKIEVHISGNFLSKSSSKVSNINLYLLAPYEFLHDITCLMKKEPKSTYRQAVIERFWLRLSQLSAEDTHLAQQLSSFQNSPIWYTLPESVRSGIPVFILNGNDSSKLLLSPR